MDFTAHGVAKSWTWLSNFHFHSSLLWNETFWNYFHVCFILNYSFAISVYLGEDRLICEFFKFKLTIGLHNPNLIFFVCLNLKKFNRLFLLRIIGYWLGLLCVCVCVCVCVCISGVCVYQGNQGKSLGISSRLIRIRMPAFQNSGK